MSGIERAAASETEQWLLTAAAERWRKTGGQVFPALPCAVNDALVRGVNNADVIIIAVASPMGEGAIDQYIDLDAVLASGNESAMLGCIIALDIDTLCTRRHRFLQMLGQHGRFLPCKRVLMSRIAALGVGAKWFAGETQLLQSMRATDDEQLREAVEAVWRSVLVE